MQGSISAAAPGRGVAALIARLSFPEKLGLLFGIVMPVVSALVFPTYVQMMPQPWMERARLLELPFVLSELLVIGWAYRTGFDRDGFLKSLPTDSKVAAAVLVAAMFASSTFISSYPADAVLQSLITVIHLYFAAAVYGLARAHTRTSLDPFGLAMAVGLVVLTVYTGWWFTFTPDPTTLPGGKVDWNFAVPGFISARYLGTWSGAIAAALLIQLLYQTASRHEGLFRLLYVNAVALTIWSGTRAAVLGVGATLLLFLLSRGLPRRRPILVVALLTVIGIGLAVLFRIDDPVFHLIHSTEQASANHLTSGRMELWLATIDKWQASPLLGWGTGSVFYEVDIGWTHTQPHNAFLQFLISWGLVGAVACCWLLGRAIRAAHVVAIEQRAEWPLLAMIYALLAMSMVDGALYYPRFVIVIVGGLALILGRTAHPLPGTSAGKPATG